MNPTVSAVSKGKWLIRVEREQGGMVKPGEVTILQGSEPQADNLPHLAYAGARAWLALAQSHQQANDPDNAISGARAGLKELGEDYRSPSLPMKDDTSLHIDLAEELATQGQMQDAARRFIQALDIRLQIYAQSHTESIAQ